MNKPVGSLELSKRYGPLTGDCIFPIGLLRQSPEIHPQTRGPRPSSLDSPQLILGGTI